MYFTNGFAQEDVRSVSISFRRGSRVRRGVLKNVDEPSTLQRNGETAFAISPDNVDRGLRFGAARPDLWGGQSRSCAVPTLYPRGT
jgi:hypothetical protein